MSKSKKIINIRPNPAIILPLAGDATDAAQRYRRRVSPLIERRGRRSERTLFGKNAILNAE